MTYGDPRPHAESARDPARLTGLRFVLVAHVDGTYRAKLVLTRAQAAKAGLRKRTLISTGARALREGGTPLSLKLGKATKRKLHAAKVNLTHPPRERPRRTPRRGTRWTFVGWGPGAT